MPEQMCDYDLDLTKRAYTNHGYTITWHSMWTKETWHIQQTGILKLTQNLY